MAWNKNKGEGGVVIGETRDKQENTYFTIINPNLSISVYPFGAEPWAIRDRPIHF